MAAKGCTQKTSRSNKQNVLHWWLSWKLGQSLWSLEQTFYWSQQGFCRCFIVDGLLFQALVLKIFLIFRKNSYNTSYSTKKTNIGKGSFSQSRDPHKATWKKNVLWCYRYAQINSGYVTVRWLSVKVINMSRK